MPTDAPPVVSTDPPQGWLPCKLYSLFGPNYRTSFPGWIGRLGGALAAVPLAFPDSRYGRVCTGLGLLIAAAGFGKGLTNAKDKTVSGSEKKESNA